MPFLRIVICPNCSLTMRGALLFFLSACVLTFAVAGVAALGGIWPALPIAALEMLALGWALHASLRRRFQAQILTITDSDVRIESRDHLNRSEIVFQRYWAQVRLCCPASRVEPSRLLIESHGRGCELGRFLTEEERRGLALRLQRLIGRINEAPPLAVGH